MSYLLKIRTMKRLLGLLFCIVLGGSLAAQTGMKKIKLDASGFSEIEVAGILTVHLVQSDRYSVEIAYEKCEVDARVEGKRLIVKTVSKEKKPNPLCAATVCMPRLRWLEMSGACSLVAEGRFECESFGLRTSGACKVTDLDMAAGDADLTMTGACSVVGFKGTIPTIRCDFSGASNIAMQLKSDDVFLGVSGAGKVTAELSCTGLEAKVSGAANVGLSGRTDRLTIENSGASKVNTGNLQAKNVSVATSGASSAHVWAGESLDVEVSGVSHVSYTGSPRLGTKEVGKMCSLTQMK